MPLMGCDWLDVIYKKWCDTFPINLIQNNSKKFFVDKTSDIVKKRYSKLLDNDLSKPITGFTVGVRMNENAKNTT